MSERTLVSFDWALKNILRDKANFGVLEGMLSSLLNDNISICNLLESESNREGETEKYNRVDLLVENQAGELIIIEIQYDRYAHYLERLLFGVSRCIVDNIGSGEDYSKIRKIICISIIYYPFSEGEEDYEFHGSTEFYGRQSQKHLQLKHIKLEALYDPCEPLREVNIFPEYYLIEIEHFKDLISKPFDEWIYFFKHSEIKEEFTAPGMQEAREKLDYLRMEESKQHAYRRYKKSLVDEREAINTARMDGWVDGHVEGHEEGREIGREEGRTIGRAEGEARERANILQRLLENGLSEVEAKRILGIE